MKKVRPVLLFVVVAAVLLTSTACGCKHENEAVDSAVAATCVETGLTEGKHCADCGQIIIAQEVVPATGHTESDVDAAAATCEKEGHAAGKMCSVCNASLSGADKIAALGHTWKDATCEKPKTCSVCNKTEGDKLDHQWADATCTKAKTCKMCNQTDGKALGHTEGLGKCTRCNKYEATLNSVAKDIADLFDDGFEHLSTSLNKCKQAGASKYYTGLATAVLELGFAGNDFEKAAELCGSHAEFKEIKKDFLNLAEMIENTFSGTVTIYGDSRDQYTLSAILDTMVDTAPYLESAVEILESWSEFT